MTHAHHFESIGVKFQEGTGKIDADSDCPTDFKLGEPFSPQIGNTFEFFQIVLCCFEAVMDMVRNFSRFFPFQPQTDSDFPMGDSGADVLDRAASWNYDSAFAELTARSTRRSARKGGRLPYKNNGTLFYIVSRNRRSPALLFRQG